MPVALRKGVHSCKLVCKDVVTGSPEVTKSSLAHQDIFQIQKVPDFIIFAIHFCSPLLI